VKSVRRTELLHIEFALYKLLSNGRMTDDRRAPRRHQYVGAVLGRIYS
jgi:hypothetical protein